MVLGLVIGVQMMNCLKMGDWLERWSVGLEGNGVIRWSRCEQCSSTRLAVWCDGYVS